MAAPSRNLRSVPIQLGNECNDPRLRPFVEHLEGVRWAMEMFDAQWRLVWVSEELQTLLGEHDPEKLGYGKHLLEARELPAWENTITERSRPAWERVNIPQMMAETPGGKEGLLEMIPESERERISRYEPQRLPMWVVRHEFVHGDLPPAEVGGVGVRLYDDNGVFVGVMYVYGSGLPASVMALMARGDENMFTRAAELIRPARHQAAVLFADLERSTALSRRLPSAAYFRVIRALTTAVDDVVAGRNGIVGKHVGDGVTAFFLAEHSESPSAAARNAIAAAREIPVAARKAIAELDEAEVLVDASEIFLNIGINWGGALYMGQVVTGGRLEVTALGDEVNETARIQEAARGGQLLATKALVERLSDHDAAAVGVDPDRVRYRQVSELPDVTEKAVRDAGSIPVTAL